MDGQTHRSVGAIPPSISERRDEDDRPPETNAITSDSMFAEEEQVPLSEVDECPVCGGEYDGMVQHFAQAHPDEYYKNYADEDETEDE